jgi:glycosyl hydrolase family 1
VNFSPPLLVLLPAVNSKLQVGTAFSMAYCQPATSSDADRQAADRAHALGNVWFVHPALHGEYPKAFPGDNPLDLMGVKSGDMEFAAPRSIFSASTFIAASSFPPFLPVPAKTPQACTISTPTTARLPISHGKSGRTASTIF